MTNSNQARIDERVQAAFAALLEATGYDTAVAAGNMSATFALNRVARHFYLLGRSAALSEVVVPEDEQVLSSDLYGYDSSPAIEIHGEEMEDLC